MKRAARSAHWATRFNQALFLLPVIVLAGIAVAGLVEYRHSTTAQAQADARRWVADADRLHESLIAHVASLPETKLFQEVPSGNQIEPSKDFGDLETATLAEDIEELRKLCDSPERSPAGLPVATLAHWRIFGLTGSASDAEALVECAIERRPSAITQPALDAVGEAFPLRKQGWQRRWDIATLKRELIEQNQSPSTFVPTAGGVALIGNRRVLLPDELKALVRQLLGDNPSDRQAWMEVDVIADGYSLFDPVASPLASAGSTLQLAAGIGSADLLYARYWKTFYWAIALIACAFLAATLGIWLTHRTLRNERRIGELKGQFVASVSHELRTPVASMRLMADALDAGTVEGDAAKKFHRLMSQEGARLSSLIENVLDFARIEEGRKDYRFAPDDLRALVTTTVQLMQPVAEERNVTIECDLEPIPESEIDSGAIEQALINLIANAIKFSPSGGVVQVGLGPAGNQGWQLSVADSGPGIPKGDRQRVFERFTRLGNELRRETQGTGIGLSIVKHIVEAHGATISIEDNSPTGARFVIRLVRGGERASSSASDRSSAKPFAPEPCDS